MSIEDAMAQETKSNRKRILSVKDDVMSKDINQNYQSVDTDGDGIYEIMYEAKFTVLAAEPKYLSYHIETFLDVKAVEEEYQIDLSGISFRGITSPPIHELVFYEFDIIEDRSILRLPNRDIWTGPRHRMDDGRWMTGAEHATLGVYLERDKIPNTIIHDYRDAKEKLQLDLTAIDKELSLIKRKVKIANGDFKLPKKSAYFSEIHLARDNEENCRYFFSIDYSKLIREGTKYGSYLKNDHNRLMKSVKLRSLKVVRKRVQEIQSVNKLLSPTMPEKDFSIEAPVETVALSGEIDPGDFKPAAYKTEALVNAASATDHGTILEMKLKSVNATGVRHFTGKDLTVNGISGLYKYGVELEIEDNTVGVLLEVLLDLVNAKVQLEQYYAEATQPDNFDVISNRFTKTFIVKKKNQALSTVTNLVPWMGPIGTYLEVLELLYNTSTRKGISDSTRRLAKTLYTYTRPQTGNPQGIYIFIEMVKDAISRLSEMLGVSSSISPEGSNTIPGARNASPMKVPLKTFKVSKFFSSTFNASAPKDTGYDYLPYSRNFIRSMLKAPGLSSVSSAAYIKRTNKETLKYFRTLNSSVNLRTKDMILTHSDRMENSKFSFLSPSYTKLNSTKSRWLLRRGTNAGSAALLQEIQLATQRYSANMSLSKTLPYFGAQPGGEGRRSVNSVLNLIDLLGQQSCVVEHLFQTHPAVDEDRLEDALDMFGRGDIDGQQMNTNIEDEPWNRLPPMWKKRMLDYRLRANQATAALMHDLVSPEAMSGYTPGTEIKFSSEVRGENFAALFDIDHPKNGLRLVFEEETDAKPEERLASIMALPNQIKSLFVPAGARGKPVGGLFAPENEPIFNYNFRMLQKVEALTGYEVSSNNELLLLSPIWRPLKEIMIFQARNTGVDLLCRLAPYTNAQLNISTPIGLELPIYDEYFIIKGKGATGS